MTTGASVPSHVSVRRIMSRLLSKMISFIIKRFVSKRAHLQHNNFDVCAERVLITRSQRDVKSIFRSKDSPGSQLYV